MFDFVRKFLDERVRVRMKSQAEGMSFIISPYERNLVMQILVKRGLTVLEHGWDAWTVKFSVPPGVQLVLLVGDDRKAAATSVKSVVRALCLVSAGILE
jgi:hypothetical protein